MTDKEKQYLIAEIERLKDCASPIVICDTLLSFIDSMQEEPVSEELEEAAKLYTLDESIKPWRNITKEAFKAGAKWQITKLMANATEVTVHIDAGGYPYIPKMELYDYDKDIPLAKKGDRYKVILIKEN